MASEKSTATRSVFRLAVVILFFSYADYGFQFVYQMITGRLLSVEDYGIYAAISSLNTLFTIFSVAFPLLTSRNLSRVASAHPELTAQAIRASFRRLSWMILPFGTALVVGSPLLKNFFHLGSVFPILVALSVYVLGAYLNTAIAALQALQLYTFSSAFAFAFTILRLLIGASSVYFLNASYTGLLFGLLFATLVVLGMISLVLRRKVPHMLEAANGAMRFVFSFEGWQSAFVISVGMSTLIGLDTSLARHFFTAGDAGIYSAGSLAAKIVMMISAPFLSLVVPEVTRAAREAHATKTVSKIIALTVAISVTAWFIVSLVPELILTIMVGDKFLAAAPLVPILAGATLCLANVSLMNQYCFALGIRSYFYCLYISALVGLVTIFGWMHDTPTRLAYGILIGAALAALSGLTVVLTSRKALAQK